MTPRGRDHDLHANRGGTAALARHIIEQHGRTRLFYVAGPPEAPDARERLGAFTEAVAQHPGATLTGCFEGRFAAVSGQEAVREILAAPRRPAARRADRQGELRLPRHAPVTTEPSCPPSASAS